MRKSAATKAFQFLGRRCRQTSADAGTRPLGLWMQEARLFSTNSPQTYTGIGRTSERVTDFQPKFTPGLAGAGAGRGVHSGPSDTGLPTSSLPSNSTSLQVQLQLQTALGIIDLASLLRTPIRGEAIRIMFGCSATEDI
ncbi:hypothetical protein BASA83_008668 [Batrachochytrium salamandrivorans]|nr:hypothetical protein BASA83_008668 [Batrachochytrium salamandrivorans]